VSPFETEREEAVFDAAYRRASELEPHYQALVDAAQIMLAAIDKLQAADARAGLPYMGKRLTIVGTDMDGCPVHGVRPAKCLIDLDEIAGAIENLPGVDIGNAIHDQALAWESEEWEAR